MRPLVLALSLAGLGGFSYASWSSMHEGIADSLSTRAQAALAESDIQGVSVQFDHMDGVVTGAHTAELRAQVTQTIQAAIPTGRIVFSDSAAAQVAIEDQVATHEESQPAVDTTPADSDEDLPAIVSPIVESLASTTENEVETEEQFGSAGDEPNEVATDAVAATPKSDPIDDADTAPNAEEEAVDVASLGQPDVKQEPELTPETVVEPQVQVAASEDPPTEEALTPDAAEETALAIGASESSDQVKSKEPNEELASSEVVEPEEPPNYDVPDEVAVVATPASETTNASKVVPDRTEDTTVVTQPVVALEDTSESETPKADILIPSFGIYMSPKVGDTIVRFINRGSAAESAGVRVGDAILKCGDRMINKANDLAEELHRQTAGDEVQIIVRRSGELRKGVVVLQDDTKPISNNTIGAVGR